MHRPGWPPKENDTESYIATVLQLTSLGGKERLPRPFQGYMLEKLARLLGAMTVVECGVPYGKVNWDPIWEGYDLAFPGKRITRAGNIRSTEPLVVQPYQLPKTEEHPFRDWDEYWDWSAYA